MQDQPIRHRNHVLENISRIFFLSNIPPEWITNDISKDYGLDLTVDITHASEVTGYNFSVQIKSVEKENNLANLSIRLKKSTVNYFTKRLEPILLVKYIDSEKEAYWTWFDNKLVDLTKNQKTIEIKIPREHRISSTDWKELHKYVENVFNKISSLWKIDLNNSTAIFAKEYAFIMANFLNDSYKIFIAAILQDKKLFEGSEIGLLFCGSPIEDSNLSNFKAPWTVFVNSSWLRWYIEGESFKYGVGLTVPPEQIYGRVPGWPDTFFEFQEAIIKIDIKFKWQRHIDGYLVLSQ